MRKKLSVILICVVSILSILVVPSVIAPASTRVEGLWLYMPQVNDVLIDDNIVFLDTEEQGKWTGGFEGTSTDKPCTVAIYGASEFPAAEFRARQFWAIVNFDGKVDDGTPEGKTGSLTIIVYGMSGRPGRPWYGKWVILSGTDELALCYGKGTWGGIGFTGATDSATGELLWGEIWYRGRVRFHNDNG